jgi:hypothetical protein
MIIFEKFSLKSGAKGVFIWGGGGGGGNALRKGFFENKIFLVIN